MSKKEGTIAFVVFAILILICVFLSRSTVPQGSNLNADSTDASTSSYTVSYEQATHRGTISDFDATKEYVYFAYSEKCSVVDVFDHQGLFLYSLLFENRAKGILLIQCKNDQLYIQLKNDEIMVFSGDCLLESYSKQAAKDAGIDDRWFHKAPEKIALKGLTFYRIDTIQDVEYPIPVPGYIALSYYTPYLLIAIVILLFSATLLGSYLRKKQKTARCLDSQTGNLER